MTSTTPQERVSGIPEDQVVAVLDELVTALRGRGSAEDNRDRLADTAGDPTPLEVIDDDTAQLREADPAELAAEGEIPGSIIIDRNVLEWRLAPDAEFRIPELRSADQVVIVFCSQGYASSLAAASLQRVGLPRATDLDGGFLAWEAAGLPVTPYRWAQNVDRTSPEFFPVR